MEVPESSLIGSAITTSGNGRPRLLHSFGATFLTVGHKIYGKAAKWDNPIGSLARTLASIGSPILEPVEHQWMSILALIDDQVLAIEDVAMAVFLPATHVFNKMNELALLAESLTEMIDKVVDRLPMLIHQLPLLDWALTKVISVLKIFSFESWNSSDEGDIMVDVEYDKQPMIMVTSSEEEELDDLIKRRERTAMLLHDKEWTALSMENDKREVEEACKEIMGALEKMGMVEEKKGADGEARKDEAVVQPESGEKEVALPKSGTKEMDMAVVQPESGEKETARRDQILELFDEGWQLRPLRGKKVQQR